MIYLKRLSLLDENSEWNILVFKEHRNIYNNLYPLKIFPEKELKDISFSDITIFYGNNGSGKTTLLNIIAAKLNAKRKNKVQFGRYFDLYLDDVDYELSSINVPKEIKIISSDDVFDYLLDLQAINASINRKKEELTDEYFKLKDVASENFYNDWEMLKKKRAINSKTVSKYVRESLGRNNIISQSNGETALLFWEKEIKEDAIYLLDEPENSLSAANQLKLKKFIEDSVRYFNCQFIISTHSPFLLGLDGASVYDLDNSPARIKDWTELENIKVYFEFFKNHNM